MRVVWRLTSARRLLVGEADGELEHAMIVSTPSADIDNVCGRRVVMQSVAHSAEHPLDHVDVLLAPVKVAHT